MKILWITNDLLPEAKSILSKQSCSVNGSGSWVYALYESIQNYVPETEIRIASVSRLVNKLTVISGKSAIYYVLPFEKGNSGVYNSKYEQYWREIEGLYKPDVVHIHGSEYSHGLAYVKACGNSKVVVSIQGLVSVISNYMYGGIEKKVLNRCLTIHDILTRFTIGSQVKMMKKRGNLEVELLSSVKHIIGRTTWDKAHGFIINPTVCYHYNGENLRDEFYSDSWNYKRCTPHTIFMSQGQYAYKGLHNLLKALAIVKKFYPNVKLIVAGPNILRGCLLKSYVFSTCYGLYIAKLIAKFKLSQNIKFVGPLDAVGMKKQLLASNIYVLPSYIENSPNSLGEAQLLGVPCIAADVGGVPDLISNQDCEVSYRFEDYELLAYHICQFFRKSKIFDNRALREIAAERYNRKKNVNDLLNIYADISKNSKGC